MQKLKRINLIIKGMRQNLANESWRLRNGGIFECFTSYPLNSIPSDFLPQDNYLLYMINRRVNPRFFSKKRKIYKNKSRFIKILLKTK